MKNSEKFIDWTIVYDTYWKIQIVQHLKRISKTGEDKQAEWWRLATLLPPVRLLYHKSSFRSPIYSSIELLFIYGNWRGNWKMEANNNSDNELEQNESNYVVLC